MGHIFDYDSFGGMTEREDISGLVARGDIEDFSGSGSVESLYDASGESEAMHAEGDRLELETVITEAVGPEVSVKTLDEIG